MFYGDGSSGNGTMYRDTLRIGNLQASLLLGAMHEESRNFELPYTDGVLGMAFQQGACHPACIPPAMDAIVNQTGIQNVFTICVSRFGGTLTLGAADKSLSTSDYKYIPLQDAPDPNRYVVPAKPEWKINNRTLSVPSVTAAVWSTATTQIAFSKSTFLNLLDHLMEHYCHIPDLCSTYGWFRPQLCSYIPDESVAAMPNITIALTDDVSITLTPDDYLIKYRVIDGKRHRCVAMIATDSLLEKGYGLLLGSAVMKKYAIVFDRGAYRVGVADAKTENCGPETGSEDGLPGGREEKDDGEVLTADAAPAPVSDSDADSGDEARLQQAEVCRAQKMCSGCAKQSNCSFGYQTGRCVPIREATSMPYPFCTGAFCACFAVGGSGWYFGIVIGGLLGIAIVFVSVLIFRKRQQRNRYQMLQQYEEQDIETF
ncbi:Aspartic peptidase [Gracilaria domingensis]|nr:Aspartic peptidase [Gracilaria domingensis]KAI0556592.1 Aspartic peptidase [Gracilaria domingensis]KAI0560683.1 Aspartic peptidase [Gracilaria domingensis]